MQVKASRRRARLAAWAASLVVSGTLATGVLMDRVLAQAGQEYRQYLPPDFDKMTPARQAVEERIARIRAQVPPGPPPQNGGPYIPAPTVGPLPPELGPRPVSLPRHPAGAGIITELNGAILIRDIDFWAETQWRQEKGDDSIVVYTGAATDDPAQGVVAVRGKLGSKVPRSDHRTPAKAGTVRIVGADGDRLTLRAGDGTTFTFDVSSRRFVP